MNKQIYIWMNFCLCLFLLSSCSNEEPKNSKSVIETFQFTDSGTIIYSADAQEDLLPLYYIDSQEQFLDIWQFDTVTYTDNADDITSGMNNPNELSSWYCAIPWAETKIVITSGQLVHNEMALSVTLDANDTPYPRKITIAVKAYNPDAPLIERGTLTIIQLPSE